MMWFLKHDLRLMVCTEVNIPLLQIPVIRFMGRDIDIFTDFVD